MELLPEDPILEDLFYKAHGDKIITAFNQDFTSGTFEWIPSDSYQRFTQNLTKHSENPNSMFFRSLMFYKNNPIIYTINEQGFRDDPLYTKPQEVDLYLGCSFSFGIGLHLENTWVHKVQKYLNFPGINASVPGSGVMTHYRMLVMLSKKFKIRNVFHFTDFEQPRIEWYKEALDKNKSFLTKYKNLLPNDGDVTPDLIENIFNDRNITYIQHLCKYAIKGFCEDSNINLFTVYHSDANRYNSSYRIYDKTEAMYSEFYFNSKLDFLARDLSHLSIQRHHYIYLYFLDKLGVNIFKLKEDNSVI